MEEDSVINLTPLIDVVFVILIMFILVAPMLDIEQVDLAKKAFTQSIYPEDVSPIQIHILKEGKILVNKETLTSQQMQTRLEQLQKRFPNANPLIFCDKQASFGCYQEVKNALEHAGFKQMQVALKSS